MTTSDKPDPGVVAMRQALKIDGWGADIYRVKRRIGEMMLSIKAQAAANGNMGLRVADIDIRIHAMNKRLAALEIEFRNHRDYTGDTTS